MNIEIANRLLELRKAHGYSQEALAEKLGLSRQSISKWERAEASPDTDNLILLAQLYHISIDELLLGTKPTPDHAAAEAAGPCHDRAGGGCEAAGQTGWEKLRVDKNGLSAASPQGETMRLDGSGLHAVSASGDAVHIDQRGVRVEKADPETAGSEQEQAEACRGGGHIFGGARWSTFPIAVVAALIFFLWGSLRGDWHIAWLVFLLIPLYETLLQAVRERRPAAFCYPVLTVLVYLLLGFCLQAWHPGWLVFLTIPLYYWWASSHGA